MTTSNIKKNLCESLLVEHPQLKAETNPYKRFYIYRTMTEKEFRDLDRGDTSMSVYRKLNWYDEKRNNKLEPDTFFASSHNLMHKLFNKFDKMFYINDFKKFCLIKKIDYDALQKQDAQYNRYLWMIEPNVISHYDFIVKNQSVLDYIETTHEIGNFMIIPKGFGWEPKCKIFNESPFKSLYDLERHWSKYSDSYVFIESFDKFKEHFLLEDFYLKNGNLITALDIDLPNDSYSEIFEKMKMISKLIRMRTQEIVMRLQQIA